VAYLQKLDPQTIEALSRLVRNPDFKLVTDWFAASLARADKSNRSCSGDVLFRSQGASQVLEELTEIAETTRKTLAGNSNRAAGSPQFTARRSEGSPPLS
jgi:hypothetical protein